MASGSRTLRAGSLVALVAAALSFLGQVAFEPDDVGPYDAIARRWTDRLPQSRELTLVDVGARARDRKALAGAVDLLRRHAPKVIALDVLLDEARRTDDDEALATAIAAARAAGVGVVVATEARVAGSGPTLELPIPRFLEAGARPGIANLALDGRGSVRGAVAWVVDGEQRVLGFAPAIADAFGRGVSVASDAGALLVGPAPGREIPVRRGLPGVPTEGAGYYVSFAAGDAIATVTLEDLERADADPASDRRIATTLIAGRAVLLGEAGARRNADLWTVPELAPSQTTAGVVVQAHALRTLLDGRPPVFPTVPGRVVWTLLLSAAASALCILSRRARTAGLACLGLSALAIGCALGAFALFDLRLPLWCLAVPPLCAFAVDVGRRARAERAAMLAYLAASGGGPGARSTDASAPWLGRLPTSLAVARARARAAPPGLERVEPLIDAVESAVRCLATVAVADALRCAGPGAFGDTLRRHLAVPTFGRWLSVLREAAAVVARDPGAAVAPSLSASVLDPDLLDTLDRFVRLRNDLRHGASLAGAEARALSPALERDVDALLSRLAFLDDLPWIRFTSFRREGSRLLGVGEAWTGPTDVREHVEIPLEEEPPMDELVVVSRATGRFAPLAPLACVVGCAQHGRDELAVFHGVTSSGNPRWLAPVSGCVAPPLEVPSRFAARARALLGRGLAASLLLAAAWLPGCGDKPVPDEPSAPAVVVGVQGVVTIERVDQGGAGARPAKGLETLASGDVVAPGPGAEATLLLPDGRTRRITSRTVVGGPRRGGGFAEAALPALLAKIARMEAPPSLAPAGAVRGEELHPLFPRTRVRTGRPRFTWEPLGEVERARLRVLQRDGAAVREVWSVDVEGTHYEPGIDRPALEAGGYLWDLTPLLESGKEDREHRSVEVPFRVLGADEAASVAKRLEAFESSVVGLDARLTRLLRACALEQDGVYLQEEARRELEAALAANPKDAGARAMLDDLDRRLGLLP